MRIMHLPCRLAVGGLLILPVACLRPPSPSIGYLKITSQGELRLVDRNPRAVARFESLRWEHGPRRPKALSVSPTGVMTVARSDGALELIDAKRGRHLASPSIGRITSLACGVDGRVAALRHATDGVLIVMILDSDGHILREFATGLSLGHLFVESPTTTISWDPHADLLAVSVRLQIDPRVSPSTWHAKTEIFSSAGRLIKRFDHLGDSRLLSNGRIVAADASGSSRYGVYSIDSGQKSSTLPRGRVFDVFDDQILLVRPQWGLIVGTGDVFLVSPDGRIAGQFLEPCSLYDPLVINRAEWE